MLRSSVGDKRARDNGALKFIPGLTLSQHPPEQRKKLFMMKFRNVTSAMSLHPTQFEGYTIRERFERMGWEQLLNMSCDKIYKRVVIQWVASLSRNGDELTGIVDGKTYTITPAIIRDLLGVDTRKDLPYDRLNKADFRTTTVEACNTVFGLKENAQKWGKGYLISKMTPLAKILYKIGEWSFSPHCQNAVKNEIYLYEMHLLHALSTGDYLYSFAHLMIDDIWDMYEHQHREYIPHGYYLSEILSQLGAVSEGEYVEIIPPQHRFLTTSSFMYLNFSQSSTEYIIYDSQMVERVTFPKKVIETEAPPQLSQTQSPHMLPRMRVPNQDLDINQLLTCLQNLKSQSQKQHTEMMTLVTNIQKQMERREEERERQAEIRAHAIIWDIERQRYFYEQEQEQLHKAWNKAYGSEEFQFPQISHTSFHPPQARSRYYDPTQGNEIPKAFQDIFHDIYGTRG